VTRSGGTRVRAVSKPVVVLAGEDRNDRQSLRILLEEFCPQMRGRIVEINDTVRLRSASPDNLARRVGTLAKKARAKAALEKADLACVFVHEDLDRPDSDEYTHVQERVTQALTRAFGSAHYVLSVWEMEAWLLLFPDALTSLVSTWQLPAKYRNRNTGLLDDPKLILKNEVSRVGRRYRESDAPGVFDRAVSTGCIHRPTGTNRSWDQLRHDVAHCCTRHVQALKAP
jgi:hypothetical protein